FDNIPVEVTGNNPPAAIQTFDELLLPDTLKSNLAKAEFTKPTPVQKHGMPIILSGRDVMACAQTGSGKTQETRTFIDRVLLKNPRKWRNTKDVASTADEFHILKEGLRIVDEVRDCLVKRIADIQEQKLYEQLNNVSPGNTYTNTTYHQDIDFKISERRKNIGKTGIVLDSSQIESLSTHFKGLKTVLDQAKQPRSDR
ncbi:vasa, partial, partial [Paramuricea clavata]